MLPCAGFAFQAFFGQVDASVFEGFLKAGSELCHMLEGDDRENLEISIDGLRQKWQVGECHLIGSFHCVERLRTKLHGQKSCSVETRCKCQPTLTVSTLLTLNNFLVLD